MGERGNEEIPVFAMLHRQALQTDTKFPWKEIILGMSKLRADGAVARAGGATCGWPSGQEEAACAKDPYVLLTWPIYSAAGSPF